MQIENYILYLQKSFWGLVNCTGRIGQLLSKRLVKSPKLYCYDTGLACSLLELRSPEPDCLIRAHVLSKIIVIMDKKSYFCPL